LRAFVLFVVVALQAPTVARADDRAPRQLTIDLDAASIGFSFVGRIRQSGVLLGGGGGFGVSPILGTYFATGTHFASAPHVNLYEVASGQFVGRVEIASWLRLDAGVRAGVFINGSENYSGGGFVAYYAAPALAWKWLWIGPRVELAVLDEHGEAAMALILDYVIVRFVKSW
jgi:hypothetical protein